MADRKAERRLSQAGGALFAFSRLATRPTLQSAQTLVADSRRRFKVRADGKPHAG
jgi:hypothetical protein